MRLFNPLFKVYDCIFVVSWKQKDGQECRVTVASEKQARTLFADLKRCQDVELYAWHADNRILKIA